MAATYFGGAEEVQLGDRVSISIWFRSYVPGISTPNREFEYNGMQWAGIRLEDGRLVATPILGKTRTLKKKVHLIARDSSPCQLITPDSKEFEERGEGPAL